MNMNFREYYSLDRSPKLLEANDIQSLAMYMKTDSCRNVFLMLGAGVSTSAGIPDFRSPETGLYANLARLNLPYPEAVFQINFFRSNPVPFYTLAKELYPGRYRPTITHSFIKVLHSHGLLHTCFTQNIDTLERRAGVPESKIVEAHGSFATQRCIDCKLPYDDEKIKKAVLESTIPRCENCKGLVKPDIVFFGEALPPRFHMSISSLRNADLLIVIGTSLTVHPFASLVDLVPGDCPRVLINMEEVGDFDRQDDVILLGKCDHVVKELCQALGWQEELDKEWAATAESVEVESASEVPTLEKRDSEKTVSKEVEKITREIEKTLSIHEEIVESQSTLGKGEKDEESRDTKADEEEIKNKKTDQGPQSTTSTSETGVKL